MFGRNEEPALVFGEAKSFAAECFKTADIDRMKKVAEKFPGAFIVFATLKDELSDAEKSSIGELAMQGRERALPTYGPPRLQGFFYEIVWSVCVNVSVCGWPPVLQEESDVEQWWSPAVVCPA